MPWIYYENGTIVSYQTWHYNATYQGITTGRIQGPNLEFASLGTYSKPITYIQDNQITYNKNKNYLFETTVTNFAPVANTTIGVENVLRLKIGIFSDEGINYWQGRAKYVDYISNPAWNGAGGGFGFTNTLNKYPPRATRSTPPTSSFTQSHVLQFFSKPSDSFVSPKMTTTIASTDGKVAVAEFGAKKYFANKNVSYGSNTIALNPAHMSLIKELSVKELDFQVQGWAVYKELTYLLNVPKSHGWAYLDGTYSWRVSTTGSGTFINAMGVVPDSQTYSLPLYGEQNIDMVIASDTWTVNNFISIPIEDGEVFNLEFDLIFSTQSGPNKGPDMKLYLSNELPISYTPTPERGLLIATFTQSNKYYFYNINGGNYLYFVGGTSGIGTINFADIGNISIKQGYSLTDNNKQFAFQSTLDPYSEPTQLSILGADPESTYITAAITDTSVHITNNGFMGPKKLTYTPPSVAPTRSLSTIQQSTIIINGQPVFSNQLSVNQVRQSPQISGFSTIGFFSNVFGTVSNLTQLNSKVGNGTFNAGVWENGIWNSGWRVDENVHEFNDISLSFNLKTENVRWRIQLDGPTQSVSNFEIGDRISIGNIVSIDINEKRKLLKNYFTIVNKNDTTIIVEVDNAFPIRRIQKDSLNHKILVTKNVWLNGGFLNGYFEGVWNDGLFKGYPYITEMYNSHWIDGKFEGGHFYAEKPSFNFVDTYYWEGYVGLTFGSVTHSFLPGDLVTIDKTDKTINPQYDGDYTITKIVDGHLAVTNIQWGDNTANESGVVSRRTSTGLIQNFTFYDNNKSTKTSKQTRILKDLWRYSSWIDVNYSNQSTSNINSDRIYNNKSTTNFLFWRDKHKFGIGDYAVLNLYGYVTDDVLSSVSYFKGLDSLQTIPYNLGTKYEVYQDFLGDISNFNNPFDTDPELGTLDNFILDGWTWSFSGIDGGTSSYLNNLVRSGTTSTTNPNYTVSTFHNLNSGNPTWSIIPFQNPIENSFGLLIGINSLSNTFTIQTSGVYNINIEIPSSFSTSVTTDGLEGPVIDNDFLFLTGNVTVGQLRLVKYSNGTFNILTTKTIKTTNGDFNIGTEKYGTGDSSASYQQVLDLFIDWKGSLSVGDQIRLEFQGCQVGISNYNAAGPWRGSGFEQGFAFADNIISSNSNWALSASRKITISNAGLNNSLGFNMRRTSNGTLLVEHLENSFHSVTLNNRNINIPKNRYSMIEFDLIQAPNTTYQPIGESYSFHWTDLYNFTSFINSDLSYSDEPAFPSVEILLTSNIGGTYSTVVENPTSKRALWSGIDYTKTSNVKKREFFYNRPGLDLGLLAEQKTGFREQIHELDNIKFYEVDMIPFFQYTTQDYIDSGIKIPFQGKAPFIDYTNAEFSFIESVLIGLDSIELQQSTSTFVPGSFTPFIYNPSPGSVLGGFIGGSTTGQQTPGTGQ